jgi:hypothetical protein
MVDGFWRRGEVGLNALDVRKLFIVKCLGAWKLCDSGFFVIGVVQSSLSEREICKEIYRTWIKF